MEQTQILTRENCPVCSHPTFNLFLKCKDHTVSGEYFNIVSCAECGFKFTNPVPHPEVIGRYYKSEEYISHSGTKKGLVAKLYHLVRNITLKRKLRLIDSITHKGRLLDYGCGTGHFLAVCQGAGWRVTGVEPDDGARKQIGTGLPVFKSWQDLSAQPAATGKFDVVTMWHVLEHVFDLDATLQFFRDHLTQTGALIIAVPNYRSRDAARYGAFWAAYDVPRHLYHFDKESLARLAKKAGFHVERVLPMRFDSYYVSMLSEKYKGAGSIGMVRALVKGFVSNLSASRTGEYSSLIYILRPQASK